ncbi:MAG: tetratricopeptide repeat protein, partial [Cyanobacteria bacterium]|nr:tetratricopeptide repeat protein [Cyanobacteriota bacterium]
MQVSNSQHWRIVKYILVGLGISCLLLTIASFVLYNLVFKARFAPAADVESGQTVTVVYAKQPFDILDAMPENLLGVRKILKKDVPAYAVQDQAEAIDSLSLYRLSKGQILRSFAIRKPSGWVDYMIVARSYYSSNPARALDMLQRVIEMNPKYAHAYLWAGWCNYDLGRYEEAMRSFDKALELDSSLNNAYDGRALTLIWQGDYERAERDCNLAIQLCPSDT